MTTRPHPHLRLVPPPAETATVSPLPTRSRLDALLASIQAWSFDERGVLRLAIDDTGPWLALLPRWVDLANHPDAPTSGA